MKSLFFRTCCTVLTGFTTISMLAIPQASANERHITCGSRDYGYNYCRIRTDGRARMAHQLSKKSCRQGDSWGYDNQGIWVDKGCRADFVVGEPYGNGYGGGYGNSYNPHHNSSSSRHDDNIGAAVGVAAGAVILGALIAGSQNKHSGNHNSHYNDRHYSNIPSWAVGTFQGYNSQYNANVELTIAPSGQVYAMANGSSFNGSFDGRILNLQNTRFDVEQDRNGLVTIQQGDYQNQVHYIRVR